MRNCCRYTLSNCYWQATVSHSTEVCGCKVWNFGRATAGRPFCVGENLTCFRDSLEDFTKFDSFTDNDNRSFTCYDDCESYTHELSSSSGTYPNAETFLYDFHDYCAILGRHLTLCN